MKALILRRCCAPRYLKLPESPWEIGSDPFLLASIPKKGGLYFLSAENAETFRNEILRYMEKDRLHLTEFGKLALNHGIRMIEAKIEWAQDASSVLRQSYQSADAMTLK